MKHPTNEEWMGFIYGESPLVEQTNLQAHLHACPDCRARVDQWRQTTKSLDQWPVATAAPGRRYAGLWKIAAALVGCAAIGFALGRQSIDAGQLQAALEQKLETRLASLQADLTAKQQLALQAAATDLAARYRLQTEQLVANVAENLEEKNAEDQAVVQGALRQFAAQYQSDYLSLRKALETVAVMTEAGFESANQRLVSLAKYQAEETP
jgi:hypothetical protein